MVSPIKNSGGEARKVAEMKRGTVLRWLLTWQFSDRHILTELIGIGRSGAYASIKRMVDAGLIGATRVNGCPVPILHLREPGLAGAQRLFLGTENEGLSAPIYPSKLNVAHVQHDLIVQRFALDFVHRNQEVQILSEYQVQKRNLVLGCTTSPAASKVPDALLLVGAAAVQQRWALEIQETTEDKDVAERKLSQYAEAISRGEIYGLIYASTTEAIVKRLEKMAHGSIRRWWYNADHKRWYPDVTAPDPVTPDILQTRMMFLSRPNLASTYYQYTVR